MISNREDTLMLTYVKKDQRFMFFYRDSEDGKAELLQVIAGFARDREMPFSWHDASLVAKRVRGRTVSPEELMG